VAGAPRIRYCGARSERGFGVKGIKGLEKPESPGWRKKWGSITDAVMENPCRLKGTPSIDDLELRRCSLSDHREASGKRDF